MLGLFLPWDFALAVSSASTSLFHIHLQSPASLLPQVLWKILSSHEDSCKHTLLLYFPSLLYLFIYFSKHYVCLTIMCCAVVSHFSCVWLFVTPWTVAHQAPLSMGIIQARILKWVTTVLQGIFPTQGSNSGLPHWRWILYHLSHQGSPRILEWVA